MRIAIMMIAAIRTIRRSTVSMQHPIEVALSITCPNPEPFMVAGVRRCCSHDYKECAVRGLGFISFDSLYKSACLISNN